jgi:hypothetical protein
MCASSGLAQEEREERHAGLSLLLGCGIEGMELSHGSVGLPSRGRERSGDRVGPETGEREEWAYAKLIKNLRELNH